MRARRFQRHRLGPTLPSPFSHCPEAPPSASLQASEIKGSAVKPPPAPSEGRPYTRTCPARWEGRPSQSTSPCAQPGATLSASPRLCSQAFPHPKAVDRPQGKKEEGVPLPEQRVVVVSAGGSLVTPFQPQEAGRVDEAAVQHRRRQPGWKASGQARDPRLVRDAAKPGTRLCVYTASTS